MVKKLFSKSSIILYQQCPYKWKKCYIDDIKSISSYAQQRGINIHKKIEEFYKKPVSTPLLKNFINFELRRVREMKKVGKFDKKYFYPIFQELKLENEELGLKGIIDAVYINPKDEGIIIIDWKSGQYKGDIDGYRFELAVYAELLKHSGKVDDVKYWGIYWTDQDKLFFEEIDKNYINQMYETIEQIKKEIELEKFEPKPNIWCKYCQFKKECGI